MTKLSANSTLIATLLLLVSIILTSCNVLSLSNNSSDQSGSTNLETMENPLFSLNALSWGMSEQEVLDALSLNESEVVISERTIPEDDNFSSRTLTQIRCNHYHFQGIPIVVIFTFVVENTDPQWDLGFSRLRIDVESEDSAPTSKLKEIFESSTLNSIFDVENLTEKQKNTLRD